MTVPPGGCQALSLSQRYLGDLAHLAQQIPMTHVERRFRLEGLVAARETAVPRPGWLALFTKALAFVAAAHGELRQTCKSLPSPCVYEHPDSVAAIGVSRPYDETVPWLWARVRSPERRSLVDLDSLLRRFKEDAGHTIGQVRRVHARCRWPQWVRRLAWWHAATLTGLRHARRLGTMAVASVGQQGAALRSARYPATAVLSYGPLGPDGTADVSLQFDARVLTVVQAAAILQDVERALTCEILMELRYYQQLAAA
jgi:hypothetical protein